MPAKPYAFRYPFDIATVLRPLGDKLNNDVTNRSDDVYDQVVALLTDRDRAVEDYLSLGVGQGVLGYASSTTAQTIGAVQTDLTGMSVTVSVPANRVLKLSAYVSFEIIGTVGGDECVANLRLLDEANNIITADSCYALVFPNLRRDEDSVSLTIFITPPPGVHTYRLAAVRIFDLGTPVLQAEMISGRPGVLIVEDIGPVSR